MPAAMNRIEALRGEANLNGDPTGDFAVSSAGRSASDSPTCPASPQRARVPGICPAMILLTALGIAGFGTTALASDGVLEINQTCAVQTGCFAGDTAGFPVTINGSAGKSYRLTSDLVVPNEHTHGIEVSTDNVSIDLSGFEIQGPVVCSGTTIACVPNAGTGSGVYRTSGTLSGISVRNGSIRGMGYFGVSVGTQSEVTNLRVRSNRLDGIQTGIGSTVTGNTAYRNGNFGINTSSASTVSGNTAYLNGNDGIVANTGTTVSGNTAYDNDGDGIRTSIGSNVWGNTVSNNTGFGLVLGADTGYRENVISNNTAGTVSGASSINLGANACNGSSTCP